MASRFGRRTAAPLDVLKGVTMVRSSVYPLICEVSDFDLTVAKLTSAGVTFTEVLLHKAGGPVNGIKLEEEESP